MEGTKRKMEEIKDRRSFDRLNSQEISALLVNSKWYYLLKYKLFHRIAKTMLGKSLLQNLSTSGSCILCHNSFKPGDIIRMIIYAKDQKNISIKGTVRWISPGTENNTYYAGIRFVAYGNRKQYNSYKTLDQLRLFAIQNAVILAD